MYAIEYRPDFGDYLRIFGTLGYSDTGFNKYNIYNPLVMTNEVSIYSVSLLIFFPVKNLVTDVCAYYNRCDCYGFCL